MFKNALTAIALFISTISVNAQVHYGKNNFTEYHRGSLPIIISVPHGGLVEPDSIPDRICNNPTTVTDSKTIELAMQIDSAFFNKTGCHIHLIICNLKRTKLDSNRNLSDGACGNSIAETAWTEFHNYIDSAQAFALAENNNKAFYIDLHGHGKVNQRLELGYLLSDNYLELPDSVLNTSKYIVKSSIQNLVNTNVHVEKHADLLRGTNSLGTMLGNAGFPSVPSIQIPKPDTTTNYFDGGYNTENYTSKVPGNIVNGLQIECNNTGVRDTYLNRKLFADSLSNILIRYLSYHQNIQLSTCNVSGINKSYSSELLVFPSILGADRVLYFSNENVWNQQFSIYNSMGQLVQFGLISTEKNIHVNLTLPAGMYFIQHGSGYAKFVIGP